jgi:hypothetical protein
MKWLAIIGVICLVMLAGCGAGQIRPPSFVCEHHGGVQEVQVHYQGYPGEKQDTLCKDGYFKIEP